MISVVLFEILCRSVAFIFLENSFGCGCNISFLDLVVLYWIDTDLIKLGM